MRRIIINGTLAVVLIFGAVTVFAQTSGSATNRGQIVSNCASDQLALSETEGEADIGGKRYAKFLLTNISKITCSLTGYPTVSLLNGKGQPMPRVKVKYNDWRFNGGEVPDSPPTATLEPGKTAWFQIFYTNGMIAANLKKPAPASAKIKVKAPKTKKDFVIKSELHVYREIEVSYLREGSPD